MKILGVDTLEFGIDIENYDNDFCELLQKLDELKKEAQTSFKNQFVEINRVKFLVNKKGQGFYNYKIECEQFYICFMSHAVINNSPIFVRFMSEYLWEYGYKEAFEKFMKWFKETNAKIIDNRISRLDICFDTDEIEFIEKDIEHFVTKATKTARHYVDDDYYTNKIFSGFTIGKGGKLSCRIYDKTLEIKKSNKKWFEDIWKDNGWNSKSVWRIEFQIRRKILKELNINKVEDIEQNIEEVWGYLTQKWLILKKKSKDTNISRWQTQKKWLLVQKENKDYIPTTALREKINKGKTDILMHMCIGSMETIAAINHIDNTHDTYMYIIDYMKDNNNRKNTTFKQEVKKKKMKYI